MSQNLFDTQLPIKCHVAAVDVLNEHQMIEMLVNASKCLMKGNLSNAQLSNDMWIDRMDEE